MTEWHPEKRWRAPANFNFNKKIRPIIMYSLLRIQYVHYTPDSVVQYTPKYSLYIGESIFQAFSELKIAEKVNTKIMKRNRYHKLGHTKIFRGVISMM